MKRWRLPVTVFLITLTLLLAGEAALMAAMRTHAMITGGEAAPSVAVSEEKIVLSSFGEEWVFSPPDGRLAYLIPPPVRALGTLLKQAFFQERLLS